MKIIGFAKVGRRHHCDRENIRRTPRKATLCVQLFALLFDLGKPTILSARTRRRLDGRAQIPNAEAARLVARDKHARAADVDSFDDTSLNSSVQSPPPRLRTGA